MAKPSSGFFILGILDQADACNKENSAQYAERQHGFNISCAFTIIQKAEACVYKAQNSQNSEENT